MFGDINVCFWLNTWLQSVEAKCSVRSSTRIPISLGPTPSIDNWGDVPTLDQLGMEPQEVSFL